MSTKIAAQLKRAKRQVWQTMPEDFRVIAACARIFHEANQVAHRQAAVARQARRHKTAYSARDITMAVNQLLDRNKVNQKLQQDGLPPVPNIDWGKVIVSSMRKYAYRMPMDMEDAIAELFTDMLAGDRGTKIRDRGAWKHNIIEQIEAWARDGYDKRRMEGSLVMWTKNKAENMMRTYEALNINDDTGFDSGEAPGDSLRGQGRMYESLFTFEGLTRDMMGNWMSMSRRNPVLKDLVQRIRRKLEQRGDEYALIFEAYMQDPSASMDDLLDEEVFATDPSSGAQGRIPLWMALGFNPDDSSNKGKLGYRIKKLRELLISMYPVIESTLRDLQMK